MVKLVDVLNKRFSTRNLSDIDFDAAVPSLAVELSQTNYYPQYTPAELNKDWDNLCKWTSTSNDISSTSRMGMKLSEHYCPNFY